MKKSKILSTAFIITSIALISWTFIVIAGVNGAFSNNKSGWTSNNPSFESITKNDGYYNISLAFSNVTYNEKLNGIVIINSSNHENDINPTAYLNGTAVGATDPISCNLQRGDSLQVNLVFPCANLDSGTTINIHVMGDVFGCGGSVVLP
ncbi:MAG: hypothetical protein NWE95_05700 [Candidatus Bathyarchaeota archaeon]|nr:hypothetical protein [Candidatus Bathyarchaeota archaeon]